MRAVLFAVVTAAAASAFGQAPASAPSSARGIDPAMFCGDGIVNRDLGEECDKGPRNADSPNACRKSCKLPRCGDGIIDDGETCDDGNTASGDGCPSICVRPSDVKAREAAASSGSATTAKPSSAPLDPARAFQLAVGVSLFGPPGLGLIYGPSAGHIYAGEYQRAALTSGLRLALLIGAVAAARGVAAGDIEPGTGRFLIGASGLAVSGLVLIDVLDASAAVRRQLGKASRSQ